MSGGAQNGERKLVKLRNPIALGSETIEVLEFRELEAGDLFGCSLRGLTIDVDATALLRLAGKLAGQPEGVIKRLKGADIGEVLEVVSGFLEALTSDGSGA
jgi:hypothetical protein